MTRPEAMRYSPHVSVTLKTQRGKRVVEEMPAGGDICNPCKILNCIALL